MGSSDGMRQGLRHRPVTHSLLAMALPRIGKPLHERYSSCHQLPMRQTLHRQTHLARQLQAAQQMRQV
jgi:hypothetical protein